LVDTFSISLLQKTVRSERFNEKQLVTHHLKFDQILDACDKFGKAADTEALKVITKP